MMFSAKTRSALLACVLGAAFAGPAAAQLDSLSEPLPRTLGERPDRRLDRIEQTVRELRAILFQGRDTGRAVVVQPAETQGQVEAMGSRVEDLEATLRRINGQLDTLATDIAALRRDQGQANGQQTQTLQALSAANARIEALERQVSALAAAQATAAAAQAAMTPEPSKDPKADLDNAMQLFAAGQYRAAASAFQTYLDAHGDSAEAQEASYYLGESKHRQRDFDGASLAYISAIRGYPATSWAPDAMVKLSESLIEMRRTSDACGILATFNTRYPRASAALKANATQLRTRARCT